MEVMEPFQQFSQSSNFFKSKQANKNHTKAWKTGEQIPEEQQEMVSPGGTLGTNCSRFCGHFCLPSSMLAAWGAMPVHKP